MIQKVPKGLFFKKPLVIVITLMKVYKLVDPRERELTKEMKG